jgi:hypothetical protein
MRFAFSRFSKAIVIGVLGCAAAVFVACGDTNGLLSGDRASSLDNALDGVSSACARGNVGDAESAAARVQRQVEGLAATDVDRRLLRNLRQGADTIAQLVPETCTAVTETMPTITEQQTPVTPETTPSTTPETPTTTPTTPDTGGGTTTTPDTGGGTTTPPDTGGGTPDTGGGGTPDTGGGTQTPDANQGNPGGALAPGQGGSTP